MAAETGEVEPAKMSKNKRHGGMRSQRPAPPELAPEKIALYRTEAEAPVAATG